jgi:hypothetical protein
MIKDNESLQDTLIALQRMGRLGIEAGIVGQKLKEELMSDESRKKIGESWLDLHDSLLEAVDEAGGAMGQYRYDYIKNMTVADFFNRIATNNIRFICVKEKK